jgi:hypothetical protein
VLTARQFADTQRGFELLGLKDSYAKIAAYALHSTFTCVSYPYGCIVAAG